MTKAAELAKMGEVLTNSQIGGRRNIIINGAMQVAQRGTSTTGLGANAESYDTVDRIKLGFAGNTAGRLTASQSTDAPNGFSNSFKLQCTTADTSVAAGEYALIQYLIEGQDLQQLKKGTSDAEKVTISFYVKGNANATYTLELYDADNARQISKTFSVTSSWNRITLTYDGDTTGAFNNDNGLSLYLFFWIHAGSTWTGGTLSETWTAQTSNQRARSSGTSFFDSTDRTFFITGLQMELGSVATPFESRSFGEELGLCQRYMQVLRQGIQGWNTGGSNGTCVWTYPLQRVMRSTPTITCTADKYRYGDAVSIGTAMTSISLSASTYNSDTCAAWTITGTADASPVQYRNQLLEPNSEIYGSFHFISEL